MNDQEINRFTTRADLAGKVAEGIDDLTDDDSDIPGLNGHLGLGNHKPEIIHNPGGAERARLAGVLGALPPEVMRTVALGDDPGSSDDNKHEDA